MRWFHLFTVFALVSLLIVAGCKGKKKDDGGDEPDEPAPVKKGDVKLPEVTVKEFTTLKGRVVYDGTPPEHASFEADVSKNKTDGSHCMMDKTEDSYKSASWKVGKDGGLASVVIFVEPPRGKVFGKVPDDKKPFDNSTVVVDQPYCAFEPHVSVLRPGQELEVKNDAPFSHNTSYSGPGQVGDNKTLPGKDGDKVSSFRVSFKPTTAGPVKMSCQIHGWMTGYVWPSDTPYATVTDKDGNFEIKNAPAGTEVRIVLWHEDAGDRGFCGEGGKEGKTVTLKPGSDDLGVIKVKK